MRRRSGAPGGAIIRGAEVVTAYLSDEGNFDHFRQIVPWWDPTHMPNTRQIALLPDAALAVFGATAFVDWQWDMAKATTHLERQRAIGMVLLPAHWITIDARDGESGEYIGDDPWPVRRQGAGRNTRYAAVELTRLRPYALIVCPPGLEGQP